MPQELELDLSTTALVLIDLENDIVTRPHLAPYTGPEVVERCATLAAAMRTAGAPIAYVHVLLHETEQHIVDRPTSAPSATPPPPDASNLVPEAGFQPGTDILIAKRGRGAFHGTALDQLLRRRGVRTIVIAGIATNIGVESTARAAADIGYNLVFASDAMTTMGAELHSFALEKIFPMFGRVRTTDEILAAIKA